MRPMSFFVVLCGLALTACDPRTDPEAAPVVDAQDAEDPTDSEEAQAAQLRLEPSQEAQRLASRMHDQTDERLARADAELLAGADPVAAASAPAARSRSRKGARMGGRRGRVGSPLAQR